MHQKTAECAALTVCFRFLGHHRRNCSRSVGCARDSVAVITVVIEEEKVQHKFSHLAVGSVSEYETKRRNRDLHQHCFACFYRQIRYGCWRWNHTNIHLFRFLPHWSTLVQSMILLYVARHRVPQSPCLSKKKDESECAVGKETKSLCRTWTMRSSGNSATL